MAGEQPSHNNRLTPTVSKVILRIGLTQGCSPDEAKALGALYDVSRQLRAQNFGRLSVTSDKDANTGYLAVTGTPDIQAAVEALAIETDKEVVDRMLHYQIDGVLASSDAADTDNRSSWNALSANPANDMSRQALEAIEKAQAQLWDRELSSLSL